MRVAIVGLLLGCGTPGSEGDVAGVCNGHAALCDRPLDEVRFAGTHNSMSSAEAGWLFPNQPYGLTRQLEDGVRAMMLDTHSWEGGLYLCHSLCELGAQPLDEGLGELADFLVAHPQEVLLVIFQDDISPEETAGALEDAGLSALAWTWDGGEMPTLGELVSADTRLVVALESNGPPPDWLHHAWTLFYDTPYSFSEEAEFSCELSRGEADNPLFLVNHWLSAPTSTPELAAQANAAEVLLGRALECEEAWGRPLNFLAVVHYEQGDLFEVVDTLNGL